jgi:hypothetical protein
VFVGNLAWPDEARLRHHFAACGNITELTFFVDREARTNQKKERKKEKKRPSEARKRRFLASFQAGSSFCILFFFAESGSRVDVQTGEFKRSARMSFSSISAAEAAMNLHASMIQGVSVSVSMSVPCVCV